MTEVTTYMGPQKSLLEVYKTAWSCMLTNWQVLLITYVGNLLLVFLGLGPLSNLIKSSVLGTRYQDSISGPFDYTLLMDIINNNSSSVSLAVKLMVSLIIPMFLWVVFVGGGYINIIKAYPQKAKLSSFWSGGAIYFFRLLRLATYVLLGYAVISALCFMLFSSGGLNPLAIESESILIKKFWLSMIFFGLCYFGISTFKEIAKAKIAFSNKSYSLDTNLAAVKAVFDKRNLVLALINILVMIGAALLYLLAKSIFGGSVWPAIFIGQLFLVFRMVSRFVKQACFQLSEYNQLNDA